MQDFAIFKKGIFWNLKKKNVFSQKKVFVKFTDPFSPSGGGEGESISLLKTVLDKLHEGIGISGYSGIDL